MGGGPAGLTAALMLARQGRDVCVLEADDTVGGIARTERYDGYRFDIGGHRFFTKIEPVQRLWEELLGNELLTVKRLSRIYYQKKFFDYPLRARNALAGVGPGNALLILLSYLRAHLRPTPTEDTFEQWVTNRFGRRLYKIFFKTYTEKVWGIPCTEIRAEWAAQRIKGLSLYRAILSASPVNRRSEDIKTLIHEFRYPRLGPGQLWERCASAIEKEGGRVLLGHRVEGIEVRDGKVDGVWADTPDGGQRFEAQHVISTMPLSELVGALDPSPPRGVGTAARSLRYRDLVVVVLILEQSDLFPDNWLYIHEPGVRVGRIQNFKNWSPDLVPDSSRTSLGMEYFCFQDEQPWTMDDEEAIAMAKRELGALRLAEPSRVVDGTVFRMPRAYPIYDAEYREHVQKIRSHVDRISNLHTVGRNGMHKYNNQDHSMLTAMMAVRNMEGERHDIWSVNTDYEYHEEQFMDRRPASGGPPNPKHGRPAIRHESPSASV